MASPAPRSDRTRVRRRAQRGVYDREAVAAILDEALFCHVGFVDGGQPFVLPTAHARIGAHLYFHGAPTNRMLQTLAAGDPACVSATLLDGLVLARSALHHSMNYRSVVVLGRASPVLDTAEKLEALRALVDHAAPGRWATVRPPTEAELGTTSVVRMPWDESSAKVRVGPPIDDPDDIALPVWAGELPLRIAAAAPVPAPDVVPAAVFPLEVGGRFPA